VYGLDRETGEQLWSVTVPEQTWSLAAVDPDTGRAFFGNNNVVEVLGDNRFAIDTDSVQVVVTPEVPVRVDVSGGRRFLTVEPETSFEADGGELTVRITGDYLTGFEREGLVFDGGTVAGSFDETLSFGSTAGGPATLPLEVPTSPGGSTGTWELSRLAAPLPTILPSYNQIGVDSLHFVVGLVEGDEDGDIGWMVGGMLAEGENQTVVDPDTQAMMPLEVDFEDGLVTLSTEGGFQLEVMNATLAFDTFRVAERLDETGDAPASATAHVTLVCADLGYFAPFIRSLGFCNPDTDVLNAYGAFEVDPWNGGSSTAPSEVGEVAFAVESTGTSATLTGSGLVAAEHAFGILLVDDESGEALQLSYGVHTTKIAGSGGQIEAVRFAVDPDSLPDDLRAVLTIDANPVAEGFPVAR